MTNVLATCIIEYLKTNVFVCAFLTNSNVKKSASKTDAV
jgi:hypothetical protein